MDGPESTAHPSPSSSPWDVPPQSECDVTPSMCEYTHTHTRVHTFTHMHAHSHIKHKQDAMPPPASPCSSEEERWGVPRALFHSPPQAG